MKKFCKLTKLLDELKPEVKIMAKIESFPRSATVWKLTLIYDANHRECFRSDNAVTGSKQVIDQAIKYVKKNHYSKVKDDNTSNLYLGTVNSIYFVNYDTYKELKKADKPVLEQLKATTGRPSELNPMVGTLKDIKKYLNNTLKTNAVTRIHNSGIEALAFRAPIDNNNFITAKEAKKLSGNGYNVVAYYIYFDLHTQKDLNALGTDINVMSYSLINNHGVKIS